MNLQEFSEIFSLLATQLRATDADAATIRGYFKALQDLEPEFVALAAHRMAQQGGADTRKPDDSPHWFPKTSEWRLMARKVEREREDELKARMRKLPMPLCSDCEDTGWRSYQDEDPPRFIICDCRKLRRLEVLGRRPMPELPPAPEAA